MYTPLLCSPFQCLVQDQSGYWLFLVLVLSFVLSYVQSLWVSFLCLVLISAPLVSNPTLLHSLHTPLLCYPFQCWVQDQSWSWLFLVVVLSMVLSYNVQSLWVSFLYQSLWLSFLYLALISAPLVSIPTLLLSSPSLYSSFSFSF